ncbi:hypothetical protein BBJ28_00013154 [Nothophytophthora sp. Chile5]|nr:hypothetical protein BBJ28_00013154 [Nothophytophthora sp. Chile5]
MVQLTAILVGTIAAAAAFFPFDVTAIHPRVQESTPTDVQVAARHRFLSDSKRALAKCSNSDAGRKLREQAASRHAAKIEELRVNRRQLDVATALATNHKSNVTNAAPNTYPEYLFGDDDAVKCVLAPETTQTSYYVSGEVYRQEIAEDQAGISLTTELQFIDVSTCAPVSNLWVEYWHSNALGVYSGAIGSEPGESNDTANVDTTFLRGLVQTDTYGLAGFTSVFPGHYAGRAPHIDIVGTYDGKLLNNNTYSGGLRVHVGEIFFDQDLITQVESTEAYAANTQALTPNSEDEGIAEAANSDYDPFMEYAFLGETIEDGIFAWISIGVDTTADHNVTTAGALTATGGVQYD